MFFLLDDEEQKRELKRLKEELEEYRRQNNKLLKRFDDLVKQLKKQKITTFQQLSEQDRETKATLIRLAQETKPMQMQGRNVGVFGVTSSGKSTTLNSLLGEKKAAVGGR